jgi:hypothetical protein
MRNGLALSNIEVTFPRVLGSPPAAHRLSLETDLGLKSSFARSEAVLAVSIPVNESVEHLIEEPWRQKAIVVAIAVRQLASVVAGPDKFIALVDDDPRAVVVEPEMTFDRQRNLDRRSRVGRRAVRDRQNRDDRGAVGFAFDGKDDHAGPVFLSFVPAGLVLVVPETNLKPNHPRSTCRTRRASA